MKSPYLRAKINVRILQKEIKMNASYYSKKEQKMIPIEKVQPVNFKTTGDHVF